MSDLISRSALISYIDEQIEDSKEERIAAQEREEASSIYFYSGEISVAKRIKRYVNVFAPAVEAAPVVHASWIEHVHVDEFGDCCYIDQECSHCHVTELFVDDGVRAFCPNCGAKMDGGNSDDA